MVFFNELTLQLTYDNKNKFSSFPFLWFHNLNLIFKIVPYIVIFKWTIESVELFYRYFQLAIYLFKLIWECDNFPLSVGLGPIYNFYIGLENPHI